MTGRANTAAALATLVLAVVLGVNPATLAPATASALLDESESSAPVVPGPDAEPTETPSPASADDEEGQQSAEAEPSPGVPSGSADSSGFSAAPTEPTSEPTGPSGQEEGESSGATDDEPRAEGASQDEEPAPEQRMQRNALSSANTATVEVQVGGSRNSVGVEGLAGAQLGLYSSLSAREPVNLDWALCTSDSQGRCSFEVPGTASGEENRTRSLFVKAYSAPTGYASIHSLATGGAGAVTNSTYGFRVGEQVRVCAYPFLGVCYQQSHWQWKWQWQIHSGKTYTPLLDSDTGSGGIFPFVRDNPAPPARCGIDVAIVLDASSSMRGFEAQLAQTTTTLVDELAGTPSRVSLFNFGSRSPSASMLAQGHPNRAQLQSVATSSGASTVRNWYSHPSGQARFSIPFGREGTNWDKGLHAPRTSAAQHDVAVLITDGNPTHHGSLNGDGVRTGLGDVEHAIFSANALKAQGTHVIAVGAGNAEIANAASGTNLNAISSSESRIQSVAFDAAAKALASLLERNCRNSVSVVKQVIPLSGDLSQAQPASSWEFTAESSTAPMTRPGSDAAASTTITGSTKTTGAFDVDLDFSGQSAGARTDLSVRETPQSGFVLEQVEGKNARCTDDAGGAVPVINVGDGFTLSGVGAGSGITCVMVSRVLPPEASVTVQNTWVIDGTEYTHGSQPSGIDAALTIAAADQQEGLPREAVWGEEYEGYFAGDQVHFDQDVSIGAGRSGCELVSAQVTGVNGGPVNDPASLMQEGFRSNALEAGLTRFAVTNTLECEQSLTLNKDVVGGYATSSDWTLSVYSTPEDASNGERLFTAEGELPDVSVQADTTYQLAATEGPAVYVQDDERADPLLSPRSTGSWECVQTDDSGEALNQGAWAGGLEGTVEIPLGAHVECTATSRTAQLTLIKHVVNKDGGTLVPEDFQLRAEAQLEGASLTSRAVRGSQAPGEDTTVLVRPEHPYLVTEESQQGNLAFHRGELQRYIGDLSAGQSLEHHEDQLWVTVPDAEIRVSASHQEVYRLISYDVAPSVLPDTGGLGTLPYLIGGAGLILLAAWTAARLRGTSQNHGGRAS